MASEVPCTYLGEHAEIDTYNKELEGFPFSSYSF